jgi:hypothetical protein
MNFPTRHRSATDPRTPQEQGPGSPQAASGRRVRIDLSNFVSTSKSSFASRVHSTSSESGITAATEKTSNAPSPLRSTVRGSAGRSMSSMTTESLPCNALSITIVDHGGSRTSFSHRTLSSPKPPSRPPRSRPVEDRSLNNTAISLSSGNASSRNLSATSR